MARHVFGEGASKRLAAGSATAMLLLATSACSVAPGSLDRAGGQQVVAPTILVMAAPAGDDEIGAYVATVASQSGGSMQIQVLSRGETQTRVGLTGARIVDAVRSGDVPLALLPAREFDALGVRSLDALQAPFVIDSLSLEAALLSDQDITAPMLDEVSELGVEGLGILPGPLVHPFGITRALLAPADFDGATIAVGAGDVAARTLGLLGAHSVVSTFNGASLDGFDGALSQLPAVTGNSYHAPGRSVTADATLWPRPLVIVANADALAELTDEQRAVLRGAAVAAANGVVATHVEMEAEAVDVGCGGGLALPTAGRADLDELRAAVRPLVDEIAATEVGAAVFARVDELRAIIPVQKALVCVAKPDSWPTEVSSRLDGTYSVEMTADDLRMQGVAERDIVDENWGHYTLVVMDGRFAYTQESELACTWGYGAWRMHDELVRTTMEGGGGIAPHGTVNKPGEDFVYRWTDFGGTLELALAMDEGPPDLAYTRISDIPDVRAFPTRCPPPPEAFATP